MPVDIRVPELGESVTEATVGRWLKSEGETVESGEPLVELETDKINFEVEAETDGTLRSIASAEGAEVEVGAVLGSIEEGAVGEGAPAEVGESPAAEPEPQQEAPADGHRASPSVRRLAGEYGIELSSVTGSGAGGRVTRDDVERAIREQQRPQESPAAQKTEEAPPQPDGKREEPSPAPPPEEHPREERVRMSRRRQTIAKRLVEAQQTAAMLTTFNEIDMSAVMELRKRRKEGFQEHHGVRLGFMSFFTKAAIGALKSFPEINSELQGDELVLKYHYDVGMAVNTEEGLVVPVVRDADTKSFADIEREVGELAQKARDGELTLEELRGGTFTITNGGVFGSLLSTPILNAPQVGILGMHKIEDRPVAIDGQVEVRPMMYVALSYDHRVVDGAQAVSFLVRIKELIEDPESLLLEG
jgi:2-oxoglutarate dehydrogenase E2 component (dihydrolipoamide succinyltransferase)